MYKHGKWYYSHQSLSGLYIELSCFISKKVSYSEFSGKFNPFEQQWGLDDPFPVGIFNRDGEINMKANNNAELNQIPWGKVLWGVFFFFFLQLFHCGKMYIRKFTILTFLSVQFIDIHIVVQCGFLKGKINIIHCLESHGTLYKNRLSKWAQDRWSLVERVPSEQTNTGGNNEKTSGKSS